MDKKQSKKGMSTGAMAGIGAGIAAASVAAYLLFGPEGKKNRKVIKGWAVKMKGEVLEKLEAVKDITEPVYNSIVDQVQAKYAKVKNIDQKEMMAFVGDMRKHWKAVSKSKKPKMKSKSKAKK